MPVYEIKPRFVVVSADVERDNPVRAYRNTILGAVHRLVGVRDHKSIFHFDFKHRSWFVARRTSLDCLGHYYANGYPAVPVAGTLASHWGAPGALASVYDVSNGSRMLAESSRLPVDYPRWLNPHVR
jgi:hypothetical protein